MLGRHKGLIHYTIGQRKGLGLSFESPKYVLRKDAAANTVVLGDNSELFSSRFTVGDVNLIAAERLTEPVEAGVKVRYSQSESAATLYPLRDGRQSKCGSGNRSARSRPGRPRSSTAVTPCSAEAPSLPAEHSEE